MKSLMMTLCLTISSLASAQSENREAALIRIFADRGAQYCASLTKLYGSASLRSVAEKCFATVENEANVAAAIVKGDKSALEIHLGLLARDAGAQCSLYRGKTASPINANCER